MSDKEISLIKLREIIKDELAIVNETVDHKSINSVVGVASKLLAAVEGFKEKAPPAAINAVTPHLAQLEKVLENMLSAPGSYVPVQKKEPKMVSLKAVKSEQHTRRAVLVNELFGMGNVKFAVPYKVASQDSAQSLLGKDAKAKAHYPLARFESWVKEQGSKFISIDANRIVIACDPKKNSDPAALAKHLVERGLAYALQTGQGGGVTVGDPQPVK